MDSKIFRRLAGHLTCLYLCSCSISDCYEYFAGRDCSCRELQNLVFEPYPASLLANLKFDWMDGAIAMNKSWFWSESPTEVRYSAYVSLAYNVESAGLIEDCLRATEAHMDPLGASCGGWGIGAELTVELRPGSEAMRLTEPQPAVDPDEITALTITHDDPLWSSFFRGGARISGFWMMINDPVFLSPYVTTNALLRLGRIKGSRWRFTVNMEFVSHPEAEEFLKKYGLWVESMRFSATCECDVGAYETDCIGD